MQAELKCSFQWYAAFQLHLFFCKEFSCPVPILTRAILCHFSPSRPDLEATKGLTIIKTGSISAMETHATVVPAEVKSLGYIISIILLVQFGCGSPKFPQLPCWGPFAPWCDVNKTDSFQSKGENPESCKAPRKTSSDLLISPHCAKLLAKTDIVKRSCDMFRLMTVLYLWNQTNGHFKKLEQILKLTD